MKTQHTNSMKKYTVSQTFETLGQPCPEMFDTLAEAESAAEKMKAWITEWVASMDNDPIEGETGFANEIEAWREACRISAGAPTIGEEAGRYIADLAVSIEEVAQ
jgi:hypothetical protein